MNEEADRLTHVAREKGASWNSCTKEDGEKIEAVRLFLHGGVSSQDDSPIKNKAGSTYVIQVAERIEEDVRQMK